MAARICREGCGIFFCLLVWPLVSAASSVAYPNAYSTSCAGESKGAAPFDVDVDLLQRQVSAVRANARIVLENRNSAEDAEFCLNCR